MTKDEADRMTAAVLEFENLTRLHAELCLMRQAVAMREFRPDEKAYAVGLDVAIQFSPAPSDSHVAKQYAFELNANAGRTDQPAGDVVTRCNHTILNAMIGGLMVAIADVEARVAAVKVAEPPAPAPESAR